MTRYPYRSLFPAALLILILVSCAKSAPDWLKYYRDSADNVYYYKIENIEKNEKTHLVKLKDKQVYSEKSKREQIQLRNEMAQSTKGWDKLSHIVVLTEIDCLAKRDKSVSFSVYGSDDRILVSGSFNDPAWGHIVSSSIHESLFKKACSDPLIEISQ